MKQVRNVYAYALELATTMPDATAVGIAATLNDAGAPIALAVACSIEDEHGEPYTAGRIRALGPEPRTRTLRAIAGVRAITVARQELAEELERRDA